MGSMGKLLTCICHRIQLEFCLRVRIKPSNSRGKFEIDMARSKNNIAENVFALAPETDSSDYYAATQEKMGRLDISSSKRVYYKTKDLYGIIWEVGRFGNTFGL